jgi:putative glutamine amidotransferase
MTKKKIIGVTQRVDFVSPHDEYRDALDQRLINWVSQAGCIAVPIPNTLFDKSLPENTQPLLETWLNVINIDAVILSGGNDIGDIKHRDLTEKYLLSWSEKHKNPVLGICRGMQMMGTYAGEKLVAVNGHVKTCHKLNLKIGNNSLLPFSVNSYHNFALNNCPNSYQILAKSDDNSIEAIKHKKLPWEGWMWHPERDERFLEIHHERFKELINIEI